MAKLPAVTQSEMSLMYVCTMYIHMPFMLTNASKTFIKWIDFMCLTAKIFVVRVTMKRLF